MPSLTGLGIPSFPCPGTAVPGYRLFRPYGTGPAQSFQSFVVRRDWYFGETETVRIEREFAEKLKGQDPV